MKDYYAILGVSRQATPDELKRAYRKLAHQHHPDKAGKANETKFKEINEAYQALSDPQKRQAYDQFGTTDSGAGGADDFGGNYDDLFRQFSGGFSGGFGSIFEDLFGSALAQMQVQVEIKLTQALLGERLEFMVQGEKITLDIPSGAQDGDSFRFVGKGGNYRGGRGDLIVTVRVKYPRRLTTEQRRLLEELRQTGF